MSTDLYFSASLEGLAKGVNTTELWKIAPDGTLTRLTSTLFSGDFGTDPAAPFGPSSLTVVGDTAYFSATSQNLGDELWKVQPDGTVALAADIVHGKNGSTPSGLTNFNGQLYFVVNFDQLWTVTATGQAIQIPGLSQVTGLKLFNGELYFSATDGVTGRELWKVKADGSVVEAADIVPGRGSSIPSIGGAVVYHNELYFQANFPNSIWKVKADGSVVKAADLGSDAFAFAAPYVVFNDNLIFTAGNRTELWKLGPDGTTSELATSLSPTSSSPVFNGELYFAADDGTSGSELWKLTAGGSVQQVADLNPGSGTSRPGSFTLFNGELYFRADSTGTSHFELWKIKADGSVVQVSTLSTLDPIGPSPFQIFNGELYFRADDGIHGDELWKLKADGSVALAADISTLPNSSSPDGYVAFGGATYFRAHDNDHGTELWKIDADGKTTLYDLNPLVFPDDGPSSNAGPLSSNPHDLTPFNGELYFYADIHQGTIGSELYKLKADGSVVLVADINPGIANSNDSDPHFAAYQNELYFEADDGQTGKEVWKVKADGSVVRVTDLAAGSESSLDGAVFFAGFQEINGELYFRAKPSAGAGFEIFFKIEADGSVVAANANTAGPIIGYHGDTYFPATDGSTGTELFKMSGLDGSVTRVADINAGSGSSNPSNFAAFAGAIYFSANDGSTGTELWKLNADDTVARVADINVGAADSSPQEFVPFGGSLYFLADNGVTGLEIWKVAADGTVSQAADIAAGAASPFFDTGGVFFGARFFDAGNALYFVADDGVVGRELWKIALDGTISRVADIEPGADGSNPNGFSLANGKVYFTATTSTHGTEPWVIEPNGVVHEVADINPGTISSDPANFALFTTSGINHAPSITSGGGGDSANSTVPENTVAVTTVAASDPDRDVVHYAIVGGADSGSFSINAANGALAFVSAPDFENPQDADHNNSYVVQVRASDGSLFDDQTITVAVTDVAEGGGGGGGGGGGPVNVAPVASDDSYSTGVNGTLAIAASGVLGNDTDADGDALSAHLVSGPAHGQLTLNGNGSFSYTPSTDYVGADSFTYKANDGTADSNVATVNLSVSTLTPGTPGDDNFHAPAGSSEFNAGLGVDTVTFDFRLIDASITLDGSKIVVDGPAGSHTVLTGFEVFKFTDGTVNNADGNPLIDDLFYYSTYHDVWLAGADADLHYAVYGWHEGRNPNAFFDTKGYLATYTDVKNAGVNPLDHYDVWGWREGRDPSTVFDTKGYLAAYPDVASAKVDPLAHFLLWGEQEGRHPVNDGVWG